MKVVAFAASTSRKSINKQLVNYVAGRIPNAETELLDLNDYELPLFSEDLEKTLGQPRIATDFIEKLGSADLLVVSFAEHNGMYSAAFKNIFDWCSRQAGRNIYQDKPMLLLATSPGARGGKSVLELATTASPRFGADVRAAVSVPSFHDNFDQIRQVVSSAELVAEIDRGIQQLIA